MCTLCIFSLTNFLYSSCYYPFMSPRLWVIILGIIALLIITFIVALTLFFARTLFSPAAPTPTPPVATSIPTGQISPTPTPLPTSTTTTPQTSYTGKILGISTQTVAYKNATVVTLQNNATQIPLYISTSTQITNLSGQTLSRSQVAVGMVVTAVGTPIEGGIDVATLTVH